MTNLYKSGVDNNLLEADERLLYHLREVKRLFQTCAAVGVESNSKANKAMVDRIVGEIESDCYVASDGSDLLSENED